jgi:hypothetical protein
MGASDFGRRASRTALLLCVVFLTACDDGSPDGVAGTWDLIAIGGDPLPERVTTTDTDTFDLVVGTLELGAGNTFTLEELFEHRDGDDVRDTIPLITTGEWGLADDDVWLSVDYEDGQVVDTLFHENDRLVNPDGPMIPYTFERSGDR